MPRLISCRGPETKIEYHFVANSLYLQTIDVGVLYKKRWQMELFFKQIFLP